MIHFTADTHYYHPNIILYCNRPFYDKSTDLDENGKWINKEIARKRAIEMSEVMISNHNSVVKTGDKVYHLGDVAFGNHLESVLKRLNGEIHWIHGNHDKQAWKFRDLFASNSPLKDIRVPFKGRTQYITLCHYSMRVWNKSHYGAWCLFGHSHGSLDDWGLSLDVGVDSHNYFPISIEKVDEIMASKKIKNVDHHIGELNDSE